MEELFLNLTERELEVLQLVKTGMTNKEIAAVLHVSTHTIKAHLSSILYKTKCRNRITLAVYAQREFGDISFAEFIDNMNKPE